MNMQEVAVLAGYAAQATTASANGSAVDLSSYIDSSNVQMAATLYCVNVPNTQGTLDVKVQESTTSGSGFADISGAAFTQLTTSTADNGTLQTIFFNTNKQFVRFVTTTGGTSPSYTVAATFQVFKRLV